MNTENRLTAYFSRLAPLSDEEARAIADDMQVRRYSKGTLLLREGQVCTECYFVMEGCLRQYYLSDGLEITTRFFTEEDWMVSPGFIQKTPANHYFECLEDCTLVVGTADKENALYRRFPRFESLSRNVLEKALAEQQELWAAYVTDTPEKRYLRLLKNRPDLLQRVPQYLLAGYIGVKPESLSRIRKRIMLKAAAERAQS